MTTDRPENVADRFTELLVKVDERLAAGTTRAADGETPPDIDVETARRLRRAAGCLKLIEKARRRGTDSRDGCGRHRVTDDLEEPTASIQGDSTENADVPPTIGRFRIVRELGRGGYGVVFLAVDDELSREVALKVPRPEVLVTPDLRQRFVHEGQAVAGLNHPHILPVYEVGRIGGMLYMACAFCSGSTLRDWLSGRSEPVPPRAAAAFVRTLAEAVQHAHSRGVIHRDLKPSNILLDAGNSANENDTGHNDELTALRPLIGDFGLAKDVAAPSDRTHSGSILGTPSYMAPEQAAGQIAQVGVTADVYALGSILYELLTGRPPFRKETALATLRAVEAEDPLPPSQLRTNTPRNLEAICLKCLEKAPSRRYTTAAELADDLERFLSGRTVAARTAGRLERVTRWCRRNPAIAALAGVIGVLLFVGAILSAWAAIHFRSIATEKAQALSQRDDALERMTAARRNAKVRLYESLLSQVRSLRVSQRAGRAFDSLRAIREAVPLARELGFGKDEFVKLRTEAIACMALPDLRLDRRWPDPPPRSSSWRTAVCHRIDCYARREEDGRIVVRRFDDNEVQQRLPAFGSGDDERPYLLFSPDRSHLAAYGSVAGRRQIALWDLRDGRERLRTAAGGTPYNIAIDFSPDGRTLAACGTDGAIILYDVTSAQERGRIPRGSDTYFLRFSCDGTRLAAVAPGPENEACEICIYDVQSGDVLKRLRNPQFTSDAAWSPDGRLLATACYDHQVHIWDAETGELLRTCAGHRGKVKRVAFHPAGHLLMSSGWDDTTFLWNPHTGDSLLREAIRGDRFSEDGSRLSAGPAGESVSRWDVATGHECRIVHSRSDKRADGFRNLAFSPDGEILATAARTGVVLWDVVSTQPVAELPLPDAAFVTFDHSVRSLIVHSGGWISRWPMTHGGVQTAKREQTTRAWQLGPPEIIAPSDMSDSIDLNLSGLLVARGAPGRHVVLDLRDLDHRAEFHSGPADRFGAISPDGQWTATACKQGRLVTVHNARTGEAEAELDVGGGALVQFSPDERWLVTSVLGSVVFWNVGVWDESHRIEQADSLIGRVAFTRDMSLMALGARDHIRLLDPRTSRELASLVAPQRRQISFVVPEQSARLEFSPDGRLLAARYGQDGQVWDLARIRRRLADLNLDFDDSPLPWACDSDVPDRTSINIVGGDSLNDCIEVARLTAALTAEPDDFDLLRERLQRLRKIHDFDAALRDAGRMIALRPDSSSGYYWRARTFLSLGDYESALHGYEQSLERRPDEFYPLLHKAWIHTWGPESIRNFDRAREEALVAGRLKPDSIVWREVLGLILYRRGEYDQVVELFDGVAGARRFGVVQELLAMAHGRLGDAELARQHHAQAAEAWGHSLDPFWDDVRRSLRAEATELLGNE